ncbi:MAG: alpha/beta hydrolase [Pseudomonadota bacterium]
MNDLVTTEAGVNLWTTCSGNGEPVVLINGGPGMADYLGPVADLLTPQHTVYRYEQRGCGRSSATGELTLGAFVRDLEALRRHFGHARWTLIGHSWGVDLALATALKHPEGIRAVVGLAGGRIVNDRQWKQQYEARRSEEAMPESAAPPCLEVNKQLNESWRAYCRHPKLLKSLATLQTPVHFIYPEGDIRPAWPTEQLAELLPRGSFERLEAADHNLWLGNVDGLADALLRALEGL